jgi:hypothetical protein
MVSVLRSDGLMIWENFDGLPFKTFRGMMTLAVITALIIF